MTDSTGSVLMTSKKSASSRQQADAYSDIKTILINAYPEALSLDDLVKAIGSHWKQSEILLATNHGARINELLRDATYYPARYRINPEIIQPPFNTGRRADKRTTQGDTLGRHVRGQSPITVIHKKQRGLEVPRNAKNERAITRPTKKARRPGVFKDIVTCLIRSGTPLSAEEILCHSGIQSSKAVLMSVLSARLARRQIARDGGTKPYRYFVPDQLKASYIVKFGIDGEQIRPSVPMLAPPSQQATTSTMSVLPPAAIDAGKPLSDTHFDITITLRGQLTLTIENQTMTLGPKQTHQLSRMIRHMAD